MKAPQKRCGTCIARKVSCDRALPVCSSCARTGRICQGYEFRLSWPRSNDRKRQILGPDTGKGAGGKGAGRRSRSARQPQWIHATSWDIGVFHYLAGSGYDASMAAFTSPLRPALSIIPFGMPGGERELLNFFHGSVSRILKTFSEKPVGHVLMRIALSSNSPSCVALQRSMLALSAMLRNGVGWQSERLKLSAIQSLRASAQEGITADNATQHVAAGMVLGMLEVYGHTTSSNQWITHISGAKNVAATVPLVFLKQDEDLIDLIDWTYHHEVLSSFSLGHWRPEQHSLGEKKPSCKPPREPRLFGCHALRERNKTLSMLSDACTLLQTSSDPQKPDPRYILRIRDMQRTIEQGLPLNGTSETAPGAVMDRLYRIATLIYVSRAAGLAADDSHVTASYVDMGFSLLRSMPFCQRTFPLLIIGFEARSDEDRLEILDLVSRSEKVPPARDMDCMRTLLYAIWSQIDLFDEGRQQVRYMDMMTSVVSLSGALPPFL